MPEHLRHLSPAGGGRSLRGAALAPEPSAHRGRQHDLTGDDCPVRVVHPEAIARARTALRPDEDYADVAETFRALGDASRAKILHALLAEELCVCDLAALIGVTESAVSQHLRVLRALRVVRPRKAGRVVYYRLEAACIRALLTVALTHLDDPAADGDGDGDRDVERVR